MTKPVRRAAAPVARPGTPPNGAELTGAPAADQEPDGGRTNVSGEERHDANAHRTRSNAANHFGADGEDKYGGGARAGSSRRPRTGKGKS